MSWESGLVVAVLLPLLVFAAAVWWPQQTVRDEDSVAPAARDEVD